MSHVLADQSVRPVTVVSSQRKKTPLRNKGMSQFSDYHKAVAYVESFSNISLRNNFGKNKRDPGMFIARTKYFLGLLGNPEKNFRYIHITGTAGKGTVSTMIQEVLTASGKKTGLFTSPYATTSIEKIKVNDKYISPREFVSLVEYLTPFIEMAKAGPCGGPSSFEIFFVIALLYFKKLKCEWVVLEVGVGGRHDATNVISNPVITAITNIDYDHTEILGKTLRKIAADKMGIIKKGSKFFTSEQRPSLQKLFRNNCKQIGTSCNFISKQKSYSDYNTELVRAIARSLGLDSKCQERGIRNTRLPCRFEIVQNNPLVILDGAHNRAKMKSTVSNLKIQRFSRLYLLLAVADNHKDHQAILDPLLSLPYQMDITFTQVRGKDRRSVYPGSLFALAQQFNKKNAILRIADDPHLALDRILKSASRNGVILVTGSFFLAGEIRKRWVSEDWVLKNRKSFKV
jgi:dihydrofolate synthase/folylpolyglutamate synthase